jgi:hypothetical protein
MKNLIYLSIVLFSFACAPSNKELSKNEKRYNSVSDSLVKYKTEMKTSTGNIQTMLSDYMKLDYASYKSKYKLSDKEMTDLAQTFTISYQIARTKKEIDDNMSILIDTNKADSLLEELQKNKSDYKFDPKKSTEVENGNESDVLMQAYDSDKTPAKKKINQ